MSSSRDRLPLKKTKSHGNTSRKEIFSIIWVNWSMVKRNILFGSLSGPCFALRAAKMDDSRSDFTVLLEKYSKGNILAFCCLTKNFARISAKMA